MVVVNLLLTVLARQANLLKLKRPCDHRQDDLALDHSEILANAVSRSMLKGAERTGRQLGHVFHVKPAFWLERVRVGAPDGWIAVDEPLAVVHSQPVDAGGFAVDLNFEVCACRKQAGGRSWRVEAESLFHGGGRVWELAPQDPICFARLAEDVCCGGGAGAEDVVVFFAETREDGGVSVHLVAEPLHEGCGRVLAGEEEGLDLVHGVAHEGGTGRDVGHS